MLSRAEERQIRRQVRTINVKVKRGGVDVASRKGYYAVHGTGPMPVMS